MCWAEMEGKVLKVESIWGLQGKVPIIKGEIYGDDSVHMRMSDLHTLLATQRSKVSRKS